jgi:hypothetical protein
MGVMTPGSDQTRGRLDRVRRGDRQARQQPLARYQADLHAFVEARLVPECAAASARPLLREESVAHGINGTATARAVAQGVPRGVRVQRPLLRMWRKLGLGGEGVLNVDHHWNGSSWDLHTVALDRERWPPLRGRVPRRPRAERDQAAGSAPPGKEVNPTNA